MVGGEAKYKPQMVQSPRWEPLKYVKNTLLALGVFPPETIKITLRIFCSK